MRTFLLQVALTAVLFCIAAFSLLAARRAVAASPFHRAGWWLTGAGFGIHAVCKLAQEVFGGLALAGGSQSATWAAYLRWAPVFNHSRTFLAVGMLLAMVLLALRRSKPDRRFAWIAAGLLGLGFLAGVGLGLVEGGFIPARHYTAVAVWDVFEMLVLLTTLFILLLTNRADRFLWGLLFSYSCSIALGIFWFTLLAQLGLAETWTAWSIHVERLFFHLVMLAFAVLRWRAAGRNRDVPGMLGTPLPSVSMIR